MKRRYLICKLKRTPQCPNSAKLVMRKRRPQIKVDVSLATLDMLDAVDKLCNVCNAFTPINKHQDCKFFWENDCEHKDDEIMIRATQYVPKLNNGVLLPFPLFKEIDIICSTCKKFTSKK